MYLWLDDVRVPIGDWTWVKTVADAIEALKTGTVEVASLDNDLGYILHPDDDPILRVMPATGQEPDGVEVVKWMVAHDVWPSRMLGVHTSNPVEKINMINMIEEYGPYESKACGAICGFSALIFSRVEEPA